MNYLNYFMEKFDTHKFLYTLNHNNEISGHEVVFLDRDNNEKTIILDKIEIGASPVSCKMFDTDGNRYLVPFMRIRTVHNHQKTLVWDSRDSDLSNVKVIKGHQDIKVDKAE